MWHKSAHHLRASPRWHTFKPGAGELRWHDQVIGFIHLAPARKKKKRQWATLFPKVTQPQEGRLEAPCCPKSCRASQTAGRSLARQGAVGKCCRLEHHSPRKLCPRMRTPLQCYLSNAWFFMPSSITMPQRRCRDFLGTKAVLSSVSGVERQAIHSGCEAW